MKADFFHNRITPYQNLYDAVVITDQDGMIVDWNSKAESLFGVSLPEISGHSFKIFFPDEKADLISKEIISKVTHDGYWKSELKMRANGNSTIWADSYVIPLTDRKSNFFGLLCFFSDITKHKQTQNIIRLRLNLWEYSASHTMKELMQKALDDICNLTKSPIGFYHFVNEDQKTINLQAWSSRTLAEFCKMDGEGMHYPINEGGVWVDCVHQRKPVIHNEYSSLPHRRGLPPGHAEIIRELVVPIIRNEKIKAILGVGNKSENYNDEDIELVHYIADIIWNIIECRQAREEIESLNRQLSEKIMLLEEAQNILEQQVAKRTVALEEQKIKLQETNTALNVLLEKRLADKNQIEEKVHENIKTLVMPYLTMLKERSTDRTNENLLDIVNSNLSEVTSSFAHTSKNIRTSLTPTQTEIADLIKHGKTTEEIASLLNLSPLTISRHRQNIRSRLGLTREKANLRSFLANNTK